MLSSHLSSLTRTPNNPRSSAPPEDTYLSRILIHVQFTSKRKPFLVFAKFAVLKLVHQVLALHGVKSLNIDGSMSFVNRKDVVRKFHDDGSPRVLIFSSLGTAGL